MPAQEILLIRPLFRAKDELETIKPIAAIKIIAR